MILKILIISFCAQFLKSLQVHTKLNTSFSHIYTTLYRAINHTSKSIIHDNVVVRDESQWEVTLVAAGVVQVLNNFDRTLTSLLIVDWRFIYFPLSFQAFETCWVFIQSCRHFIKIFSAEQVAAEQWSAHE